MTARAGQATGAGAGAFTGNATFSFATGFATFASAGNFTANAQVINASQATFAGAGALAANSGLTYLVQSYTPASERNNFTGQVGIMFTPTADLLISQMGLRCGTSNTGLHTVNLYNWNGGAPIGTLLRTVTVDLTGGSFGVFYYSNIPQITLSKDIAYVLTTTVTNGDGQFWGSEAATSLNDAVTVWSIFTSDDITFTLGNKDNQFAGVDLDFKASNYTHLISSYFPGVDRNDFTGQVGVTFIPTANITFNRIGLRASTGDTGSHAVNLYDWGSGGNPIGSLLRTANVDLTGGLVGQIYYSPISPITLSSGSQYALVSPVTNGDGQFWSDEAQTILFNAGNQDATFTSDSITFSLGTNYAQFLGVDLNFIPVLVSFAGAGNFTANAQLIEAAQATFFGAGALTANATTQSGSTTWNGAATFSGAGAFTANAAAQFAVQATFAGAGAVTAIAAEQLAAQTTFAGAGGFTANATFSFATGFATFTGAGGFTANAEPAVLAAASVFAGAGGFTANAQLIEATQAIFAGAGTFTATATAQFAAQATFAGIGGFTANATTQIAGKQGAANFNGVGAFTANAAQPQRAAAANFAGAGGFTANAAVRMAAQTAFAGSGAFTANATRQGVTTWTGQAAFVGSSAFIVSATVLSFPLPVPSGRWSPVFDSNYPHSGAVSPSPHFLNIALDEIGFTLYFITPTATRLPPNAVLVFTRPDGTLLRIPPNRFYTGQNSPVIGIDPLNGTYAAYVTNADLNQQGTWTVEIRDATNNNISGAGYFSVAA